MGWTFAGGHGTRSTSASRAMRVLLRESSGGTKRSSAQNRWTRSHGSRARSRVDRSSYAVRGVLPPDSSSEQRPRRSTASCVTSAIAAAMPSLSVCSVSWTRTSATAVEEHLLAAGHHDLVQPQDLLAVGELVAGGGDDVARLERALVPPVGFHARGARAADVPLLDPAVLGLHVEAHHHVRVAPLVARHRAGHGHGA